MTVKRCHVEKRLTCLQQQPQIFTHLRPASRNFFYRLRTRFWRPTASGTDMEVGRWGELRVTPTLRHTSVLSRLLETAADLAETQELLQATAEF
jgi:hypothetical protein